MRLAMTYPADTASDADRVEWLQLNLLLQFQNVYKTALCNPSIYQNGYSPGERDLLSGFMQLQEIYTQITAQLQEASKRRRLLEEENEAIAKRQS